MSGGRDWRRERWRRIRAVSQRDLLEFVRDRRTLFVTLLMPMAMYPVLALSSLLGVRTAVEDLGIGSAPSRLALAVSGPDAVGVVDRIRQLAAQPRTDADWPDQLQVEPVRGDDARRLRDERALDAWIDLPPGFLTALDGSGTVPLEVQLPEDGPTGISARLHVAAVLRAVAQDARQRRVIAAGLPPTILQPLTFTFAGGVAEPRGPSLRSVVSLAAGAVLVLLALLMATGAFYPAIDAIAGEKERGTIETLLMAPCEPRDLVLGKFLAVLAVTLTTLAANVVSIGLTLTVLLRFLPPGGSLGISADTIVVTLVVALPAFIGLAAVAAAMSLAVTAASKSVKEAQNTLTPVILLVSGLAGAALLPGIATRPWLALVPFTGQVAVARSMLLESDQPQASRFAAPPSSVEVGLPLLPLALTLLSSAVITWLLLRATATVITDEEILFRGPDTAASGFARPAFRSRPTVMQGAGAALAGFALLWYVQGLAPDEFAPAILLQQAVAVAVPLLALSWWQRVDARTTFALRWPARSGVGGLLASIGAVLAGGGLFILGAAALLALRGAGGMSAEAEALSKRLFDFFTTTPTWEAALLVAVVPALAEESLFRGWMLTAFAGTAPPRGRVLAAVVAQAVVFALFHLLPERMPQTFALAVLLGWMTWCSGSLLPAVLAHAAHNAMPLVLLALVGGAATADVDAVVGGAARMPAWLVGTAAVALPVGCGLFRAGVGRCRCGGGSSPG